MPATKKKKPGRPKGAKNKPRIHISKALEKSVEDFETYRTKDEILEMERENLKLKHQIEMLNAQVTSLQNDDYKKAAYQIVSISREIVHNRCNCRRKAYMNVCRRFSCRHFIDLAKPAEALLVKDGIIQPINYERPAKRRSTGKVKLGYDDFDWENVKLDGSDAAPSGMAQPAVQFNVKSER